MMRLILVRISVIISGLALLLMAAISPTLAADEGNFSAEQTKEINKIIEKYLTENPEILDVMVRELTLKREAEKKKLVSTTLKDKSNEIFNAEYSGVLGNPKGEIVMVEYLDYNCGFCKRALGDVAKLIEKNKDLKIIIKEYPILSQGSYDVALVSLAAKKQNKFFDFHMKMMGSKGKGDKARALEIAKEIGLDIAKIEEDIKSEELSFAIATDLSVGRDLGINGTPAFIVGEEVISGAKGFDFLQAKINTARFEASN